MEAPDGTPQGVLRYSRLDRSESLIDQALRMRYANLDPTARYRIRVTYVGDAPKRPIRLMADDQYEIR